MTATTLAGCTEPTPDVALPDHTVEVTDLLGSGDRVQVNVTQPVSQDVCSALVDKYRDKGMPDGQVSVHMPSAALKGEMAPYCVENFEGEGVKFNSTLF